MRIYEICNNNYYVAMLGLRFGVTSFAQCAPQAIDMTLYKYVKMIQTAVIICWFIIVHNHTLGVRTEEVVVFQRSAGYNYCQNSHPF